METISGNYFVSTYPPFSTWSADAVSGALASISSGRMAGPVGLYVHIPYCLKKCDYCYYLSYAGRPEGEVDAYIDGLLAELDLWSESGHLAGRELAFAYFGGGTPSVLSPAQIGRLAVGLRERLPWDEAPEVTFECAPRTVGPELIAALRELGVTRASMGVQSLSDEVLAASGRLHLREDVLRAWDRIRCGGFEWANLDVMAGLPGESRADWEATVRGIIALEPPSVTVYQTEVPHNTKLHRDATRGTLAGKLATWDEKRRRVELAFEALEAAGFTVVTAYSAVRSPERHRFLYQERLWSGCDMLGAGVASYSYLGGVHFQNAPSLRGWKEALAAKRHPVWRARRLSRDEALIRELVLQLKYGRVPLQDLSARHGLDVAGRFAAELDGLEGEGLLRRREDAVELTRRGLLEVDGITPRFYLPEHRGLRYT